MLLDQAEGLRAALQAATDRVCELEGAAEAVGAVPLPPPTTVDSAEIATQTTQLSMLAEIETVEGGASLSPSSLSRKLEVAAVSNELLRDEIERAVSMCGMGMGIGCWCVGVWARKAVVPWDVHRLVRAPPLPVPLHPTKSAPRFTNLLGGESERGCSPVEGAHLRA